MPNKSKPANVPMKYAIVLKNITEGYCSSDIQVMPEQYKKILNIVFPTDEGGDADA